MLSSGYGRCAALCRLPVAAALLLAGAPAIAAEACVIQSEGDWRGEVTNRGALQPLDVQFTVDANGALNGRYHVTDQPPLDGTLTGFHQTAPCEADFIWTDQTGVGIMHLRFEPALERFTGHWGLTTAVPGQVFNGYRRPVG